MYIAVAFLWSRLCSIHYVRPQKAHALHHQSASGHRNERQACAAVVARRRFSRGQMIVLLIAFTALVALACHAFTERFAVASAVATVASTSLFCWFVLSQFGGVSGNGGWGTVWQLLAISLGISTAVSVLVGLIARKLKAIREASFRSHK